MGDRLVIASSSFYAEEVDELDISSLSFASGITTVGLSRPLLYTHLGEVVSVAGETKVLDMRAEVTVITRNVLVTVSRWGAWEAFQWHTCMPVCAHARVVPISPRQVAAVCSRSACRS